MGTAGRIKNQFMILVDDAELYRLDALRVVMRVSRAEVCRIVLKGTSLETLEQHNSSRLARLDALAARAEYVGDNARAQFVIALVSGRVKVPTLEELEGMNNVDLQGELREIRPSLA